jgi:cell division protein FtsL
MQAHKNGFGRLIQNTLGFIRQDRQQRFFLFNIGPVTICMISIVLIGLMAVLYLSQVGIAVDTNRQLQQIHRAQLSLSRENQDLTEQLAKKQSPDYIVQHARQQGLVPADPKSVHTIFIHNLQPISKP